MKWVAGFLDSQNVHTARDVPYPKQIVPLATIRVVLGEDADVHGVHKSLRQWYWCGVLGELYGAAIESRFARDLEQVPNWARVDDDSVPRPKTIDDVSFVESRLHSLRTRNSAAYKGVYALLMAQGTVDWLMNQPFDKAHFLDMQVDIHHIFPKAWCIKNGIDDELRESIANKTPLAKRTNIKLSGHAPSVYLGALEAQVGIPAGQLDGIIAAHQIDVTALREDRFLDFFVSRRAALCALIENAMGKPVSHDIGARSVDGGTETSEAFESEPDDPDESTDESTT